MIFPQIVQIHDLFMTIQVSDSDSRLFRFIHDCGNPDGSFNQAFCCINSLRIVQNL